MCKLTGAAALGFEILMVFSKLRQIYTKMGPIQVRDATIPPDPWSTSGPIYLGCSQQDLSC